MAGEHNAENGAKWIDGIYAAVPAIGDYFDAVAVHPYGLLHADGSKKPAWSTLRGLGERPDAEGRAFTQTGGLPVASHR